MNSFLPAAAAAYGALRLVVFAAAVLAAAACLLSWLVRTRRVSPFSGVARFTRRVVDPLMAPVERMVVRRGGLPANAPWWVLAAVVVGGIVLLTLVQFLIGQVARASVAMGGGGGGLVVLLVGWTFGLLRIALIVRVLSSWVGGSAYSKWLRWAFVLTDPIILPLRRVVPTIGMIDITPIVAYFGLVLLESVVMGVLI